MALANYGTGKLVEGGRVERPAAARLSSLLAAAWAALGISRSRLALVLPARWAITVPALAMALILAGALFEPAPAAESTGGRAVLEAATASALMGGLVATVAGAMTLRRWGIASALGVSLFSLGLVVTCPLSGHHTFGLWFGGELACVLAAVGLTTCALVRTNR